MEKLVKIIVLLLGCSLLVGFSFGEKKPKEKELRNSFSIELPSYLNLSSFNVDERENYGSKVEPRWASRFSAVLKTTTNLYSFDTKENGISFVTIKTKENAKIEVYGKSMSVLYQGSWKHSFDLDGNPVKNLGKTIASFKGKQVIIRGSKEETVYYAKQEAKRKEEAEKLSKYSEALSGNWEGTYICSGGITGLTLSINTSSSGLRSKFEFYPITEKPIIKSGSFFLMGNLFGDGSFILEPQSWEQRPEGYSMVGMKGKISHDLKQLTGSITKTRGACSGFELSKKQKAM